MTDDLALPRSLAALEAGVRRKIHGGAQLHVSLRGVCVADVAVGLAAPNKPMTVDSMMTWLSCSKIAASIAFAQLWERGDVAHDSVCAHIPEFAANGKENVTIRHVWTHTFGPEPGLVLCCSWNGMVGDDATHLARQSALCKAIYEDLGLTP